MIQEKNGLISIVIPVYNEAESVVPLYESLQESMNNYFFEVIYVNDGSTDETMARLASLQNNWDNVSVVSFSRNFGHEVAMTAGMEHAVGEAVVFMDGDFQHPPEVVPNLVEKWLRGWKVVLTRRTGNDDGTFFSTLSAKLFYSLLNRITDFHIPSNNPDFRLLDRKYVSVLQQFQERDRVFRAMLNWIGPREITVVDFHAPARREGRSKYSYLSRFALAVDAMVQMSVKPLRIATFLGLIFAILSCLLGLWTIVNFLLNPELEATGYNTVVLSIIGLGSMQLIMLGILGEYIGRIHQEVKHRPLYISDFMPGKSRKENNT